MLNQNYSKGWRATIWGTATLREEPATTNTSGLVSIPVHPGDYEVEFYYLPNSFVIGACVSAITLVSCLIVLGAGTYISRTYLKVARRGRVATRSMTWKGMKIMAIVESLLAAVGEYARRKS